MVGLMYSAAWECDAEPAETITRPTPRNAAPTQLAATNDLKGLKSRAQGGDAEAQYELGRRHANGNEVSPHAGDAAAPDYTIRTRDGKTYGGAAIYGVEPDGLRIEYQPPGGGVGMAKLRFENLSSELQQQYEYDAQKADDYRKQQAKELAKWNAILEAQSKRAATEAIARLAAQDCQEEGNSRILAEIVSNYRRNHTYVDGGVFVCGDMACDVWNMVKTKGIEAQIAVGNVERDISSLSDANHAWVLAETSPGKWLALETTAGRVVSQSENARYYKGWFLPSPKEFKSLCYSHRQ